MIREALLYDREAPDRVRCRLCAHRCRIPPGGRGVCGVRENREGVLQSLVYGTLAAENVDPIEKKPLFHLLPGSLCFSIAAPGCNFCCDFCQNHELSQMPAQTGRIAGRERTPAQVVEMALASGSRSIAYTYTEPTVAFEFAFDTAGLARERGLRNILVTNGYLTAEALDRMAPRLAAANVDLKACREDFYRRQCGASLAPVLESLRRMKALGIWVEVTTLLIPDLNDSEAELRQIAGFIVSLGPETPWHVSRFYPRYRRLQTPPTPAAALDRAVRIGRASGLKYVYSGNMPGAADENTRCARCGRLLIARRGFAVTGLDMAGAACPGCGTPLEGIF
jgi:pyruvate formate lyase activating enzyme